MLLLCFGKRYCGNVCDVMLCDVCELLCDVNVVE